MVLQRGPQRAVLWGTADTEGDTVTAQVAGQGSAVTATVQNGVWKLQLPPVTEAGPFVVDVRSGDGHVTLTDVLFGDVWLCSGQSNMKFEMDQVLLFSFRCHSRQWKHGALRPQKPLRLLTDGEVGGVGNFYI